jgi:hypothetical protein
MYKECTTTESHLPKKLKIWKEDSEKEIPLRSGGTDSKKKCGRLASNCSIRKYGAHNQRIGMTGERKEGREIENHRRKTKKNLVKY